MDFVGNRTCWRLLLLLCIKTAQFATGGSDNLILVRVPLPSNNNNNILLDCGRYYCIRIRTYVPAVSYNNPLRQNG